MTTYTLTQHFGPIREPITGLADLEVCQRAYIERRDASGLGASSFGEGFVSCDQTGEAFRISYNGRLWFDEPWKPGVAPLMEAPSRCTCGNWTMPDDDECLGCAQDRSHRAFWGTGLPA